MHRHPLRGPLSPRRVPTISCFLSVTPAECPPCLGSWLAPTLGSSEVSDLGDCRQAVEEQRLLWDVCCLLFRLMKYQFLRRICLWLHFRGRVPSSWLTILMLVGMFHCSLMHDFFGLGFFVSDCANLRVLEDVCSFRVVVVFL